MRSLANAVFGLLVFAPASVLAGEIYGTIRDGPNPLRLKTIEIACPDFRPGSFQAPKAQTDNYGSFRVNLNQRGRCQLRIDNSTPVTIFSSDNPIRYDFQVTRGPSGLELRRQ